MGASCFWTAPHLEKTEESSLYRQPMSDRQWQENLAVLKTRIGRLDQRLVHEATGAIHAAYDWLEPLMVSYCEITCPACSDVCCQATRVFFNHTDLLVILALGLDPPPGQTRPRASEPCRYLTQAGCSLKRTVRPYVCVWYLCEAQMDLYREEPALTQRRYVATLASIRTNRLRIEGHYESHFPPLLR
jgi:hypothetical protein